MTLTRIDIVDSLVRDLRIPRQLATKFFEEALESIGSSLSEEGTVKISSFGTFHVRQKAKRIGRNPKTGREAVILPRKSVSFRPSQYLKERAHRG